MSDQSTRNTTPQRQRVYPPGYGVVEPVANYRPWDADQEFQRVYQQVRDATMVDVFRLWTLWFLTGQIPDGDILEVGSWRGGSGALLARRAAGEGRRVCLADTFSGVVKAGPRDTYYKGGEHANTSAAQVRSFLSGLGLGEVELLAGVFPEETGGAVADRHLALCHIDVDVYQSARDAFEFTWQRVVPGGVVVFDDYGFYGCEGVTAYVEELASGSVSFEGVRPVVVPSLSGQAIITKAGY